MQHTQRFQQGARDHPKMVGFNGPNNGITVCLQVFQTLLKGDSENREESIGLLVVFAVLFSLRGLSAIRLYYLVEIVGKRRV